MSDYSVSIKILNARIKNRMRELGFQSLNSFCVASSFRRESVGQLLNLRKRARNAAGEWRPIVLRLAKALACEPDDLFTEAQAAMALKTNEGMAIVTEREVLRLVRRDLSVAQMLALGDEHRSLEDAQVRERIRGVLSERLDSREFSVLSHLYGIGELECDAPADQRECTLESAGRIHGVSRERAAQIEAKALRKLRHPLVAERLREAAGLTSNWSDPF